MTIGESIKKARKDKGYTLETLSMESGVPLSTIGSWELDYVVPTVTLLCCVADVLEVSLDKLIDRTTKNNEGEWRKDVNGKIYCSECRARPLFMKSGNTSKRVRTPYCPRCGAKMKEIMYE